MIEVAQPWALLALLSVPAILILHSLRPTRRNVVVASNALWREALRERRRGLGLRKLLSNLSLLLLLLFALLASLALGDPQWLTRTADRGDVVVILDTSASMQTRTGASSRFELARRQAAELIDDLPGEGRMLIMSSGRNPVLRSAFDDDKRVLRDALASITVSDEAGRPRAALSLALSLLRHRERGQVYFLTDGAFDEHIGFGAAKVEYRLVGGPARNVAITRFDVRAEVGSESRFQVLLTVTSHAEQPLEVPLAVSLDGQTLVEQTLRLPAGATHTEVWPFSGRAAGRARASIDIDDDLAVDNQAFAVLGAERTLRVLLLSPGSFYLESALRALPNVQLRHLAQVPAEYLEQEVARHDVTVIDRLVSPELPPGAYLLVDSVPPGLPFAGIGSVTRPVVAGRGASALLQQVDLTGLRVDEARRVRLSGEGLPLQRLFWSAETTLALAGIDRQRRFVYLGFDPSRSSFPLQAAFPLFIRQSVEWLRPGGDRVAPTQIEPGEPYAIGVPVGRHDVIVRDPDGEAVVHAVEGGELLYEQTSQTGIYQYSLSEAGGLAPRYFAVNLADGRESDINPRPLPEVDAEAPGVTPRQAQATLSLWPWLAAAALLVLVLEWCVLFGRRRHA